MSSEVITTEVKEVQKSSGMAMDNGVYALSSVSEQMTYAKYMIEHKLVSETFKTSAQLLIAIQLCKDLGLPNSALSCFYVVGGKPAIYGDVLIGLVMGSGLIEGKTVSYFDDSGETIKRPKKGQKIFGCEVTYTRKGFKNEVGAFYTMDDKESSKTSNPTWIKYSTDMLWRRADVRAIKMIAPDAMKGIEVVEYLEEGQANLDMKEKAKLATKAFSDD
jgi:hypothetical protein